MAKMGERRAENTAIVSSRGWGHKDYEDCPAAPQRDIGGAQKRVQHSRYSQSGRFPRRGYSPLGSVPGSCAWVSSLLFIFPVTRISTPSRTSRTPLPASRA